MANSLDDYVKTKKQSAHNKDKLFEHKAMSMQMQNYISGMKELVAISDAKQSAKDNPKQEALLNRMECVLEAAVHNFGSHITAGTIWRPNKDMTAGTKSPSKEFMVTPRATRAETPKWSNTTSHSSSSRVATVTFTNGKGVMDDALEDNNTARGCFDWDDESD